MAGGANFWVLQSRADLLRSGRSEHDRGRRRLMLRTSNACQGFVPERCTDLLVEEIEGAADGECAHLAGEFGNDDLSRHLDTDGRRRPRRKCYGRSQFL